jgi:hypothetical protein
MSRWESPTFNSSLVGLALQHSEGPPAFSATAPAAIASGPQGGTQLFSHHVLSSLGVECPAASRENAWRFAFFSEYGGPVSAGRRRPDLSAVPEEERKKRAEAAERAWRTFCERDAPKRLAGRKSAQEEDEAEKAKGRVSQALF